MITLYLLFVSSAHFTSLFPRGPPHKRDDDADPWSRSLYYLEAARSCGCENDAGVRKNHQPKEG